MDYKKYSLEKLEEWVYDSLNAGEAAPQEIYDTIKKVVQEQYYYHKNGASKTGELLSLLNGTVQFNLTDYNTSYFDNMCGIGYTEDYINFTDPAGNVIDFCGVGNTSDYCKSSWNSFWENDAIKEDKVVKWQLPVEVDGPSGEYFVTFPDDLLEAANLKEGDQVDWVDNGDGSYTLKKVENRTDENTKV